MKTVEEMRKPAEEMAEILKGLSETQKEFVRGLIMGIKLQVEQENQDKQPA